ncbi:MAG TPA: multiheme c-type cytochrome [Polyangiaceae bacterium]
MRASDAGLVFGVIGLALAAGANFAFAERPTAAAGAPATATARGSVGSGACQKCHPDEYASWHRSFHRTMTRLATPESVKGPFDGTRVESEGRTIELSRHGDKLFAKLPDPEEVARRTLVGDPEPSRSAPLVTRRVVLVTGSHHHEVYWALGSSENELRLVPVTYVIAERRFIPRRDAFLQPPDAAPHAVRWNSNCIQCHTTLGRPKHDEAKGHFDSEATELGIACEACHGEGAEHARKHQNPFERYAAHLTPAPDPSIVNPARLSHDRASEVCGQCHAYFVPKDETSWWQDGFASAFRPGDPLERSRTLLAPADFHDDSDGARHANAEADFQSAFWNDGTMRVGGRELGALALSACYTRGPEKDRISCLSCHSMHRGEPDDQLRPGSVDAPCKRCHESIAKRPTEHSHHAAASSGNSCVACHMPYTSYALFKGIRSHRIDSPNGNDNTRTAAFNARPNACNLCHLDRTLAWTRETLATWYGGKARAAPGSNGADTAAPSEPAEALAVELLLAGDAASRAIAAWAFGLPEAQQASGTGWEAPFLAAAAEDPYAAVRLIAARSLRSLPALSSVDAATRAHIQALVARRDNRPVTIVE